MTRIFAKFVVSAGCILAYALLIILLPQPRSTSAVVSEDRPCIQAQTAWLPDTPSPKFDDPPPHPAPDCPFYQSSWQTFLFVTQPDSQGRPRFLEYASIEDLFGPTAAKEFAHGKVANLLNLAPRNIQQPNEKSSPQGRAALHAGVTQAGPLRGILIDQNGNPIFYGIHVNDVFANFLKHSGLLTKDALLNADPEKLEFPKGSIELKSAWRIVEREEDGRNHFTTEARVPNLRIKNGVLVSSDTSRKVTVALMALHVVFILDGHPEFIWSTFEHVGSLGQGIRDNAPALVNPQSPPRSVVSGSDWPLFKGGMTEDRANVPLSGQDLVNGFDERSQHFRTSNTIVQTSVYRLFSASKSAASSPDGLEDGDILDVNAMMRDLFLADSPGRDDIRRSYQLVGAVWLDNPSRDFRSNMLFQNADGQSTDADGAMVAGEDRLSSTAMESFTQLDRPNCFSCHNTKRVTDDVTQKTLVGPKRLNVSHVMSKFLAEQ
ncbi:MAG: hypothetical protein ACJ73D_07290 [Pyrinomonadaceae bacterium]